ncbi:MAG: HNH endonuclease [Mariniphaga sp.]|nr:HNH endonuclease [Mariniphaga sp.]
MNEKQKSRYIPKSVRNSLLMRSGGICECCGAAGVPDQHHLEEYAFGGVHTLENLLLLCPACHRQIAKYLTQTQQQELQKWNQTNIGLGNLSTTSQLRGIEPSMDIGTVKFMSVQTVLKAYDQNIITIHKESSGIFMNILMLEGFEPKLMVLSNKVIVNDNYIFKVSRNEVIVQDPNGETKFTVTGGQVLTLRGRIIIYGEPFIFTEDGFKFRELNMRYVDVDCANLGNTALTFNESEIVMDVGGAKIIIGNPNPPRL